MTTPVTRVPRCRRTFNKVARVAASIPVILGFVAVLAGILTTLFAIEAFITRLYTGPFHQHVVSEAYSNHFLGFTTLSFASQGPFQHDTLHGLCPQLPRSVPKIRHPADKPRKPQTPIGLRLFSDDQTIRPLSNRSLPRPDALRVRLRPVRTTDHDLRPLATQRSTTRVERDGRSREGSRVCGDLGTYIGGITTTINTTRLQNQMYAYTVTNQIVGTFLEVGLPYIMRFLGRIQGGAAGGNGKAKGKRVDFQDESSAMAGSSAASGEERKEERELVG
jgi:anoctamin-10